MVITIETKDDLTLNEMRDIFGAIMLALSWSPNQVKSIFNVDLK